MSTNNDHPNVIIFPPIVLGVTVALGAALQWAEPLGVLAGVSPAWRIPLGGALAVAGVALAATGRRLLAKKGTNVSPLQPTTVLATDGVYRLTRNPLYTGGTILMFGIALIFGLDWLGLLIPPSVLILHFGVVRREEDYLEQKFGAQYRSYKASVPRYGIGI